LEAFLVSAGVVALGEMGDKTQLLAIVLATMFRRPWPIAAGILVATLVNHTAAGALGAWVAHALGPDVLRWAIGTSFLAMAAWMLIPDKFDEDSAARKVSMPLLHGIAAAVFAVLGVLTLLNLGDVF
jgi:putative Ca2+/H+ antiporter (TMEM165/GDT1 family)